MKFLDQKNVIGSSANELVEKHSFDLLCFLCKVLCLNYNQIESILPGQKFPNQVTNRQHLHRRVASSGYGQQELAKERRYHQLLKYICISLLLHWGGEVSSESVDSDLLFLFVSLFVSVFLFILHMWHVWYHLVGFAFLNFHNLLG